MQKLLNLMSFHLLMLTACDFSDVSKKALPMPVSLRVLHMLSSNNLMASGCRFSSLIHLDFIEGDR